MDTYGLINHRNLELWNSLLITQDIEIRKEKREDYCTFSKGGKSIIFVPYDNLDQGLFTHELLHVYLRSKEIYIAGSLKLKTRENKKLSRIFSDDLIDHIGNCLDHIKMLPEFLNLGFSETDFISDYNINKLTNEDIFKIKKYYYISIFFRKFYNAYAINFFIGKFFSAKSCPNKYYDYAGQLKKLEKIDPELFKIQEAFLEAWTNFDYNQTDPIVNNYHSLVDDYIQHMNEWASDKIIC